MLLSEESPASLKPSDVAETADLIRFNTSLQVITLLSFSLLQLSDDVVLAVSVLYFYIMLYYTYFIGAQRLSVAASLRGRLLRIHVLGVKREERVSKYSYNTS